MDRRKALKNVAFYSELPSSTIEFYLKVLHFPRMKKSSVFSGTDEEILMNLLILLFQLQNSPGAKAGVASFISIMIRIVIRCYAACIRCRLKRNRVKSNTRLQ
jgi:hypothetical protein